MPTPDEKAFEEAAERVLGMNDQMNTAEAWHHIDPTGEIRRAQAERDNTDQKKVNRVGAQAVQQIGIDAQLARIEAIPDPAERNRQRLYFAAKQRVEAERKAHF